MNMDEYSAIEWLVEDIKDVQSRLEETEDYIRQAGQRLADAFRELLKKLNLSTPIGKEGKI